MHMQELVHAEALSILSLPYEKNSPVQSLLHPVGLGEPTCLLEFHNPDWHFSGTNITNCTYINTVVKAVHDMTVHQPFPPFDLTANQEI
jgi:hypothetical protein